MFIHLQKEIESTVVEFAASIKYNKINSACQSWLEGNVLMTQSHPNHNCSWLITRKFGSYITLDFRFIEVKPMSIAKNVLISIINLHELKLLKTASGWIQYLKSL